MNFESSKTFANKLDNNDVLGSLKENLIPQYQIQYTCVDTHSDSNQN